jgi:hypothetical protein
VIPFNNLLSRGYRYEMIKLRMKETNRNEFSRTRDVSQWKLNGDIG